MLVLFTAFSALMFVLFTVLSVLRGGKGEGGGEEERRRRRSSPQRLGCETNVRPDIQTFRDLLNRIISTGLTFDTQDLRTPPMPP